MRRVLAAVPGLRPHPAPAPSRTWEREPDLARAANQRRKEKRETAGPGRAISMRRLRRFLRSAPTPGVCLRVRAHAAQFLHAFPLLWSNNHNKLGHKDVVLH